ncbi:MAG TPA: ABC transporter permease, partial [Actinomycetota bacterium]|nr:ABC transporter permease [Actinomycetota bacterium]
FTVIGIVTGSIYAVAASGIVVTYATSGIFNIAHGAIGMLMAFTFWQFRVEWGLPGPLAFVIVVFVIAPLFGALIERVLIRGLRGASVATTLVVTVALMVMLIGTAQAIWNPTEPRNDPPFFGSKQFALLGVNVSWHQGISFAAAIIVALVLWLFLTRTRMGVAMRAVVDDRNLMALNGGRPDRLSMASWAIGASLAALAGILIAPYLQLNVLVLTLLVVNAYAAAVVGKLKSLPLTFVGGMALGLVEAYATNYINLTGNLIGLRSALPTLFLFAFLLLVPEARLRAGRITGSLIPRLPNRRQALIGAGVLVAVAYAASGILTGGNLTRISEGLALAIIMLSLVPLTGFGGQVSLCQMSFAGLGAVAMAKVAAHGEITGYLAAIAVAAIVGALIALPALRLQGLYLALSTMAFAVLMDYMFFPNEHVFSNFGAASVARLKVLGISFNGDKAFFVLLAVVFAVMGLLVLSIRRSQFGRVLTAMRDSPVACATLGLNLTRTKLAVFMLSAAMAGLGGALYGGVTQSVGQTQFLMFQSLPLLLLAVIGGITSVSGALIGGLFFGLQGLLQSKLPSVGGVFFLSVGFVAILLGRYPNGISQLIAENVRRFLPGRSSPPAGSDAATVRPATEEVQRVAAAAG